MAPKTPKKTTGSTAKTPKKTTGPTAKTPEKAKAAKAAPKKAATAAKAAAETKAPAARPAARKAAPVKTAAAPKKAAAAKPVVASSAAPVKKVVAKKVVDKKAAAAKPAVASSAAPVKKVVAKKAAAAKPAVASSAAPVKKAVAKKAPAPKKGVPKSPPPKKLGIFACGDFVVYPTHGVGRISAIEDQEVAGYQLRLFVVRFDKEKMTLRIPVGKAEVAGLRKLASRQLIDVAITTLKGRSRVNRAMWSRRAQEYEAKINSGDPVSIAEVVRDLHRNAGQPDQSYSERQIYEAALDRLAREVAAVDKTDWDVATMKLEEILEAAA